MRCTAVVALCALLALAQATNMVNVTGQLPGGEGISDTMFSGYVTVDESENANLFFWFIQSRGNPDMDPVVLWMTGGPGCSSELALLFENGPFTTDGETLTSNPSSWNNVASVIYIDQPYNTGFSYSDVNVTDEQEMADDMYTFLQIFFTDLFPQYQSNPFFVTGESYGGHYVPALSNRIVKGNQGSSDSQVVINFSGASIGDGWVDPRRQFAAYGPYAWANELINVTTYTQVNQTLAQCLEEFSSGASASSVYNECESIMGEVLGNSNINYYNIKEPCVGTTGLCYDFSAQIQYMNNPDTLNALGVSSMSAAWSPCDPSAINTTDRITSFAYDLAAVLAADVPVLVYYGNLDLICNWMGGWDWVNAFGWDGQDDFVNATTSYWVTNQTAGETKTADGLTWLQVYGAGHMVPHDQPQNALCLIDTFINGGDFDGQNTNSIYCMGSGATSSSNTATSNSNTSPTSNSMSGNSMTTSSSGAPAAPKRQGGNSASSFSTTSSSPTSSTTNFGSSGTTTN